MDPSDLPIGNQPPRRELQGPRPTPLKVRKDSYKIKKPPVVPASQPPLPAPQHRPPVIIYTVSPKVIHTNVSEFMTLVQRLTGSSSSSSSPSYSSYAAGASGALSPAAKLATIEKVKACCDQGEKMEENLDIMDQLGVPTNSDRARSFPSILSPVPASLPPIPPNFFMNYDRAGSFSGILSPVPSSLPAISHNLFSPLVDPNSSNFLHDLSPIFHGNKNYIDSAFMSSPTAFLSAPITSPSTFDLFNHFLDL
ncbi:protein MKS1-like [Tasmannia lanceolata]|uniref:protein MKS1-like n=1 Tax=Tasmannia lanceolata TaxID=3420 RepID=UPI0040637785